MDSIAEQAVCTAAAGEMPKFADGTISLRELFRELAELTWTPHSAHQD